ncbi:hypothetical protein J53TS2_26650 [Paenibacillus sp. J53TS2]|nr:hypothetical protein J53TS2_26650 [Paenibacillus sp. J53TS2]
MQNKAKKVRYFESTADREENKALFYPISARGQRNKCPRGRSHMLHTYCYNNYVTDLLTPLSTNLLLSAL